jgi:PAB-dependent poly(A)-specific ribonuclease subunit 2
MQVPDDQRLWDAAPTGFMLNDRLISAPLNVVKPTHHHKQHHNVPNWVLEAEHKPSTEFMPLSAWGSLCWTSLTTTAYRPLPPIDTSLIPDLKYRDNDYLGIAKNPGGGFVRNNMNSLRRFAVVQRKSLSAEKSGANKGIGAVRHTPRTPAELEAYRAFYAHVTAPADTRDFDPRAFNATRLVGLDNSLPNAFANAALQVLYFVPAFRQHMMNHLCERESCLSCELGFLFHILDKSSSPMAQARNFLRILRQIPEVRSENHV